MRCPITWGWDVKPRSSLCHTHSIIHGLKRSRRSCPRRVSAGYKKTYKKKHAPSPKSECGHLNGGKSKAVTYAFPPGYRENAEEISIGDSSSVTE
jgi:hypothetical protein